MVAVWLREWGLLGYGLVKLACACTLRVERASQEIRTRQRDARQEGCYEDADQKLLGHLPIICLVPAAVYPPQPL
jgi:hypothetical protein